MAASTSDPKREMLRHTLATLAYRGGKTLRNADSSFAEFRAAGTVRTPAKLVTHLGDLFDWALSMAEGKQRWKDSPSLPWTEGVERFFSSLRKFDEYLASDKPINAPIEKLFQGPVADALTHVGQIAMLRRIAGAPIRGENYFLAEISAGRLGPEQALPVFEFD